MLKNHVTYLLNKAKSAFLSNFVDMNVDNQGKLSRAVKNLLVEKEMLSFPDYADKTVLMPTTLETSSCKRFPAFVMSWMTLLQLIYMKVRPQLWYYLQFF